MEILDRYARALAGGQYRCLRDAAPACWRELETLRAREPSIPPRPERWVGVRLSKRCRELGLIRTQAHWSKAEDALARGFARAFVNGRYPSLLAAARECRPLLAEKFGLERGLEGVVWHMARHVRALGVPAVDREWTRAELRVLNRHIRMLYAARPLTLTQVCEACSRELGGRRTADAVRTRLKPLVAQAKSPRYHGFRLPYERELMEGYARRMGQGEFASWRVAAAECHKELQLRQAGLSRSAPGDRASSTYGRSVRDVEASMMAFARRLGLREPRYIRWTAEEDQLVEGWRRWYNRYRRVRRLAPLKQAAEGLQEDLSDKGFRRSFAACSARICGYWRPQ